MIRRILKRMRQERSSEARNGYLTCPAATLRTIVRSEWQAFRMRRQAGNLAVRLVLTGAMTGGPR